MKKGRNLFKYDSNVACLLIVLFLLIRCTPVTQKPTLTIAPPTKVEQKAPSIESIVHEQGNAVVLIVTYDESGNPLSLGSGFFVKSDGVFITNYHVIEGAYSGAIKLTDGRVLGDIEIIDFNSEWDIAILKVEGSSFPTVKLGNSDIVKSGQKIVVIGNPEGLQNTVSDGLVSSIRKIESEGDYFIQISAPISEGSSGGPVYNMNGEVIGIATMMLKSGQNLNFAIPIKFALPLAEKSAQKDLATFTKEVTQKELDEYLKYQKNSTELKPEDTIFEYALNYYKQAEEKAGGYLSVFGTNNQEAIELLKKAINKDPNYHASYYVLGLSYQLQNEFELAQKELLIANSLKPLYSDGHVTLGEVYHKLGKFDEAISEYATWSSPGLIDIF
ncbi:MAG: trypsin-like peptidase domain-containing protein [Nitrospirae bacterium]|nr:trypsin-like peptidase domain-containing protein [Nitrospirota bacterium]